MSDLPSQLSPEERQEWLSKIQTANRNNIFCHCRRCTRPWIASTFEATSTCGSTDIQRISCWQFP